MLYKISKFLGRLRSRQPVLALLPGLIVSQSLSSQFGVIVICFTIFALLLFLVKAKNFLGLYAGLTLGLISSLTWMTPSMREPVQTAVTGRILPQGLRYPKPGLMQFGFVVSRLYEGTLFKQHSSYSFEGLKFQCRAISLPWKNVSAAQPGEQLLIQATFNLFKKDLWPWEYDAQLVRRGFAGTCKLKYLARLRRAEPHFLDKLRADLLSRYRMVVGDDEIAALLLSLSLGARDLISPTSERLFKDLGISHVLVLSGMQIALIFFGAAFLLRKILRIFFSNRPAQMILFSYLCASLISALLVHLAYYEASAVRAWIACVCIALADNAERDTNIFRGSLASFLVLSLLWPGCWAEAGVQLSFAALFGIAVGQDLADSKTEKIIFPCLFATCFTAIVSSVWFETLSVSAVAANFLLAPWFGVLGCYIGFTLVLACYFKIPFVDEFAMLSRWIINGGINVVEWAHSYMPKPVDLPVPYSYLLFLALIIFCLFYFYIKGRDWAKEFNIFKAGQI